MDLDKAVQIVVDAVVTAVLGTREQTQDDYTLAE